MIKQYTIFALLSLLAAGCGLHMAPAAPPSALELKYVEKIDQLLPGMGDADLVKRKDPQTAMEKMCHEAAAPGKETDRVALCSAMMTKVGPEVAKPARIWLLRRIDTIGRDEVVPKLTELLHDQDADIRETARRGLANNPSTKAGAALRGELAKAKTADWQVAIINTLAFRKEGQAVPALTKLANDQNDIVATAAVCALGDIRTPEAIDAVTALLKKPRPTLQARVVEASLKCAEELAAKGSTEKAAAIYDRLYDKSMPENIRVAGLQGIAATRGVKALPMLFGILDGSDAHLQMIAARSIQAIPGDEVTQQLLTALTTAKPQTAELITDIIGQRGPAAREAVAKLAREAKEPSVRNSAVLALAQLGDPSAIDTLWKLASTTDNKAHRSIALRGYVRLVREQGKPSERLASLTQAMKIADQADDKKIILSAMGEIADPKVIDQTMPLVDGDLHAEAFAATASVAKRIAGHNQALALATIEKLAKVAKSGTEKAETERLLDSMTSYCVSWMVSGPYKEKGKTGLDLFDVAFAPEESTGDAKWKPLDTASPDQPGRFDLGKEKNCCAYVRTTITSDSERKVRLGFGSDDGIKVWLNGQVINSKKVTRACTCDEDKVEATLKSGANTLLIKVVQGDGDWSFCCSVRGTDGLRLTGLKYEAK
jgi:HEAT repeat protein